MERPELADIEKKLGYTFRDKGLLKTCLTHSSYANLHGTQSNERLEFLGDAIVNFLVGEHLYRQGGTDEGEMTRQRIAAVSKKPMEAAMRALGIGYRYVSGGEQNLGKKSVSSLFEALAAGIYLDGGMEAARAFVCAKLLPFAGIFRDYKSELNERYPHAVRYECYERTGSDHAPQFSVCVYVGEKSARGTGRSKEEAEQNAAEAILGMLRAEPGEIES